MIHPNSKAAHKDLSGDRHAAVLEIYRQHGPLTDRQVATILGGEHADCNLARPRITELLAAGALVESGNTTDGRTGKTVRVCAIKEVSIPAAQPKPFCNCTFAGHLRKFTSKKRRGYVAVVCTNPVHGRQILYGYEVAK